MAITKEQKNQIVEDGTKELKNSDIVLFTDFKGTNVVDLQELRRSLRAVNATYKVIKKRLVKIILDNEGIKMNPVELEGQLGTVFAKGDISDVAGPVYAFSKDHESFEILGGIDVSTKEEIPRETVIAIGQLPPRDSLIASVVGSIAAPIRGLLYVLSEKSKQN